jgi:hypothetical protein
MDVVPSGLSFDRLPRLPVTELRRLWKEHIGTRTPPPRQKGVLIRELAWRVQERLYGGLDEETKRLLAAAMRDAATALKARQDQSALGTIGGGTEQGPATPGVRVRRPRAARALTESSRLLRTWRGRMHEVEVLAGGKRFRYRNQDYRSLTKIARLITGAHWSGPRFFGLVKRSNANRNTKA